MKLLSKKLQGNEDEEGFRKPKKSAAPQKQYCNEDEAEVKLDKLTSFKRTRDQLDPPSDPSPKIKNESFETNFYQRNRKSKKAMKKRK